MKKVKKGGTGKLLKKMIEFIQKYFIKFGMVGVVNTLVQQGLYLIIVSLGFHILFAQTISFIIAFCVSFILNGCYTYRVPLTKRLFCDFIIANLPAYLIQSVVLLVIVGGFGVPKMIALACTLIITIPISFCLVTLKMVNK